jgi:hypothetical protein
VSRRTARLLLGAAVVLMAVLVGGVAINRAVLGPRPPQPLAGPTGLPDAWRAGDHPFDVAERPIEAASVAVGDGGRVVLASADGHGYRVLESEDPHQDYRLSPDGRRLAWRHWRNEYAPGGPVLQVLRLSDGTRVDVTPAGDWPMAESYAWTPDGRRLLVVGGWYRDEFQVGARDVAPAVWEVDAATGAARLLCACGAGVRATSGGQLAQVPTRWTPEITAALPPGALRLPPTDADDVPLVSPDGRSWAGPGRDEAGREVLEVHDVAGGSRTVVPQDVGAGPEVPFRDPERLLAWTADGIWAVAELYDAEPGGGYVAHPRLLLLDPDTGEVRRLTALPRTEVTLAAGLAAGGRTVPSDRPSAAVDALEGARDAGRQVRWVLLWYVAAAQLLLVVVACVAALTVAVYVPVRAVEAYRARRPGTPRDEPPTS